jgi:uncharacterized protein YdhG (YjbR/CyaY superfamily)
MKKPTSVSEYISSFPKEIQVRLKEMRSAIKSAAPKAEEKISYSMPYYGYKGRLAYFSAAKKHIGLYVMPPTVQDFKEELKGYETAKATIKFPLDKKLPSTLIKKLIKHGVKANERY